MKIGILTFHRSINYGAFMQAYALSRELIKRYGHIVEIIDFEKESKNIHYRKPLYGLKNQILHGKEYRTKYKKFRSDLDLLPLSSESIISDNYEELFDYINNRYDIIIVGSDAVWAYNKGLGLENPYWLFGEKLKCIKLSYAASAYSLDIRSVSTQEKNYIKDCLKSFSYIGVRDTETYNFIKSTDKTLNVNMNCDPTVLLREPDYNYGKDILNHYGVNTKKKIISIMLNNNKYMDTIQNYLGNSYEYVNIYTRNRWTDRYVKFNNKFLYQLSPYEWYHIYSNCFINFTNYFHGTLLALKGDVPTISFDVTNFKYEYISKIKQILTDIDMPDFWFNNNIYSKEQEDKIISQIDFMIENNDLLRQKIHKNLLIEKKKSESFFSKLDSLIK